MTTVTATIHQTAPGVYGNCCCGTPPVITSGCPINGGFTCIDSFVNYELTATGTEPITWDVDWSGANSLTFDPETGFITGTLSNAGSTTLTYTATNAVGSDTFTCTFFVIAAPVIDGCPEIVKGQFIFFQFGTVNSTNDTFFGPLSWNASPLPPGLSISSSGLLQGSTVSDTPIPVITVEATGNCGTGMLECSYSADDPEATLVADIVINKYGASVTIPDILYDVQISVQNNGPDACDGLVVTDVFSACFGDWIIPGSIVYAGSAGGPTSITKAELAAGVVIPTLPAGGGFTIFINTTLEEEGECENTATYQKPSTFVAPLTGGSTIEVESLHLPELDISGFLSPASNVPGGSFDDGDIVVDAIEATSLLLKFVFINTGAVEDGPLIDFSTFPDFELGPLSIGTSTIPLSTAGFTFILGADPGTVTMSLREYVFIGSTWVETGRVYPIQMVTQV